MAAYKTKYDIVNRALQHLGVDTIDTFADQSEGAVEMEKLYEVCREAELTTNYWTFAIRRSISRPVDEDSLLWTPPTYAAATAYASAGLVVVDTNGDWWESKQATTGNTPDDASAYWSHYIGPDHMNPHVTDETYYTGELVKLSTVVYRALLMGVTSTPPTAGDWLAVNGTTAALDILWPIGAGPGSQVTTQNVYRLPHGYLRKAPIDPKAGINPPLGGPSANWMDDHVYENSYYVTSDSGATVQRFVADVEDIGLMNSLFCEMLAARCASEAGTTLTHQMEQPQAEAVLQRVDKHYRMERLKAVAVNLIVTEAQTPTEDDYITGRI